MELELRLDPDDAPRLLRLPLLAAATRGRAQALRTVWHDTHDGGLAAAGLALAREKNVWRLEKLSAGPADLWPPGAPPPVVGGGTQLADLGHDLPEPLAPVAAMAGRQNAIGLATGHGPVALALIRGAVRTVTAEHPIARLRLAGDEPAVLQAALALTEALRVEVACETLAGEALAVGRPAVAAAGHRPPAPVLPDQLGIAEAFAFVLGHLADVVLRLAPAGAAETDPAEPVHQMRVAVRRLRSAIAVFRPALDCPELRAAAAGLKALGTRLGPARDWDVFLDETLSRVSEAFPEEPRLGRLRSAAAKRRRECHAVLRAYLRGPDFRRLGVELAWLAAARSWHPQPAEDGVPAMLPAYAANVLDRRARKLRGLDGLGGLDTEGLHAVRLRAKRARYAAEIFAPLYPGKAPRRFIHRLAQMQDGLGRLNDRATAETLLAELGGPGGRHGYAAGLVLGFTAANAAALFSRVSKRLEKFQHAGKFWLE